MREYHVYILADFKHGTIYVGVTGILAERFARHRAGAAHSFTRRYAVQRLVHVESFAHPRDAIAREKRLKKWPKAWKLALMDQHNPEWQDLAGDLG